MRHISYLFCSIFLLSAIFTKTQAQYDPQAAFAPLHYETSSSNIRSANGAPGSEYWQNRADYAIDIKFDTLTKIISGKVLISYTNNSPDALSNLWLQLVQNIDKPLYDSPNDDRSSAGFHIHKVALSSGNPLPYLVDGTRMQIRLPQKLKGNGEQIEFVISYDYILQQSSNGGRMGYMNTKNGPLYEVSYFYPRMSVYDDLDGWNTLPFLGRGEFYLDYGNIDYRITLPDGILVRGTGVLDNPKEVLTQKQLNQLEKARHSDKTIWIRNKKDLDEPATQISSDGMLTWHFHMNQTRDVAWVASKAFLWDAARINLPDGKKSLAMSFYPVESSGENGYGRSTEYLKATVELISENWFPYPYKTAINVAGKVGGMEFPGMGMDWWKMKNKGLFYLQAHEIGHTWFPMIVGSNERTHAWMDEGFNTFLGVLVQEKFNQGEYAPKRDGEYAPKGGNPADEIIPFINDSLPPIITPADAISGEDYHPLAYFKTAFGMVLLRDVILGHERFDYAFRQYTQDWAFKHPSPTDFFRSMENKSGAELDWFWRGWFLNNWQLDQAIKEVKYVENDPTKGAVITIVNLKKMPMPVLVQITEVNGEKHEFQLPVHVWESGATHTFRVPTAQPIQKVILDPEHQLPDMDRENNVWAKN